MNKVILIRILGSTF